MPSATRISPRACARALWLLGLHEPADLEEIRAAWKRRVAQAHPDRRSDHPDAAHRLTAAFNDARDIVERWAASGQPWPRTGRRIVPLWEADDDEVDDVEEDAAPREPRRVPSEDELRGEHRSGRPGDLVRVADDGSLARVAAVTAPSAEAPVTVRLATGTELDATAVEPAGYGCPVCGHCAGPALEQPGRRPCPACLADLRTLERDLGSSESILRGVAARAREGRQLGDELEGGLGELARERLRWLDALRRRPREERRDALLAAFAHGFASWRGGQPSP